MRKVTADSFEKVEVTSVSDLRTWLEAHHTQSESIWLVTYKKSTPEKYISIQDVLDEVLCFGWMDGRRMKLDDTRTMQLLSPRKIEYWSKTYKDRVARLTEEDRMAPSGYAAIQRAKDNGSWDFYNDVDALIMPLDLEQAFDSTPKAREFYEAFPDSAKRDILRWIKIAKTDKTRTKRIDEVVTKAAHNERASGTK